MCTRTPPTKYYNIGASSPTSITRMSRGDDPPPSSFPKTRREGSRRISPSCLTYSKVTIDVDQIKTENPPILYIIHGSDFFDLPLIAASSPRGSHEKDHCPIDSWPIDST